MLTLAFDTSSKTAAVALLHDDDLLYDVLINSGVNHSEILLEAINQGLRFIRASIRDVDLMCCTLGPGSFTGLRIGIGTLKGLAVAAAKPIVGVSSLAALAQNAAGGTKKIICPVMDAGRGFVYSASYATQKDGSLGILKSETVVTPENVMTECNNPVVFLGDGAVKYADRIMKNAGGEVLDGKTCHSIRGACVGYLGQEKFRRNDLLDIDCVLPVYLRPAEALPSKPLFGQSMT